MEEVRLSRRWLVRGAAAGVAVLNAGHIGSLAQDEPAVHGYPIGWPGEAPGVGFRIGHGYACENTWYNPGSWHCGEDWYALEGNTAGAQIYAVAGGEVVFAGSDYPGRVVIIQHEDELFSMYGHLDFDISVSEGERVEAGTVLGEVLRQGDVRAAGQAPSHLHFEMRTFLLTEEVNGDEPRYGYNCGYQCPPGPGYWPIDAPDHPSEQGWRNPSHALAELHADAGEVEVVAVSDEALEIWSEPLVDGVQSVLPMLNSGQAKQMGEIDVAEGDRFRVLEIKAGDPASTETTAEAYEVWYRVELEDGDDGWVRGVRPSDFEIGSDGRPSSVELLLAPVTPLSLPR